MLLYGGQIMIGNTDKPVKNISGDTFGIARYINGLCSFILHCGTPMTISIQGDWGSGKTSMMNMVRSKIEEDVHTIWFNTWQFSQFQMQNNLAISMLGSLLSELDCDKNQVKNILGTLGSASKTALQIVTDNIAGGFLADKLGEIMSGTETDYAEKIKTLNDDFQEAVQRKLISLGKDRLVVFIDDLDRLQPTNAVELLEVMKVFLDCEKCVFVLAIDYAVVVQGIRQKFGDDFDEEKGKHFFDKIIQLPFKMPVAQYDITNYISNELEKMNISLDEKSLKKCARLIESSIGCNPRSMKRLFNTYMLLDIIVRDSSQRNDKRQMLLLAIVCMQMAFEKLYNFIVSSRDTLSEELLYQLADHTVLLGADNLEDDKLKEEIDNLKEGIGIYDDDKISRVASFMKGFIEAIQLDEDSKISDEELDNLIEVLHVSTITSVGSDIVREEKNENDWFYRYVNKDIVSKLNDRISETLKLDFRIWQPRKNTSYRRISEAWGVKDMHEKNVNFAFAFSLWTDYTLKTTYLDFHIYPNKSSTSQNVFELFGELEGYLKNDWDYYKGKAFYFSEASDDAKDKMYEKIKSEIESISNIIVTS